MMLLAIDTSTRYISLALHDGEVLRAEITWDAVGRHTTTLTGTIHSLLAQIGQPVTAIRVIAVAQGPGSFNGLRVGFSTAKGLAFALQASLIVVPTLDITAAAQRPAADGTVLICVAQAGRGRVVAATYHWQEQHWVSQNDTRITTWADLLATLSAPTVINGEIDGDGKAAIRQALEGGTPVHTGRAALGVRRAGFLAELAWARYHAGQRDDLALPFYLHQPGVPHH